MKHGKLNLYFPAYNTARKPIYPISAIEFLVLLSHQILLIVQAITCNPMTKNYQKLLQH